MCSPARTALAAAAVAWLGGPAVAQHHHGSPPRMPSAPMPSFGGHPSHGHPTGGMSPGPSFGPSPGYPTGHSGLPGLGLTGSGGVVGNAYVGGGNRVGNAGQVGYPNGSTPHYGSSGGGSFVGNANHNGNAASGGAGRVGNPTTHFPSYGSVGGGSLVGNSSGVKSYPGGGGIQGNAQSGPGLGQLFGALQPGFGLSGGGSRINNSQANSGSGGGYPSVGSPVGGGGMNGNPYTPPSLYTPSYSPPSPYTQVSNSPVVTYPSVVGNGGVAGSSYSSTSYGSGSPQVYINPSDPLLSDPGGGGAVGNSYSAGPRMVSVTQSDGTVIQVPTTGAPATGGVFGNPYASAQGGPSASGYTPPVEPPPPPMQWYRNRYVRLRNQSGQPLTFYVKYHKTTVSGAGRWANDDNYLPPVRLQPGEETFLTHNGYKVSADKIRFYVVTADGRKSKRYTTQDLVLGGGDEKDATGNLRYWSNRVGTYSYTVGPSARKS